MKITNNSVVVMHYAVSDSEGSLIDSSYDDKPMTIIQGSGYLIEGLEDALIGHQVGDKFEVDVSADKAYGERHDDYVQTVPKELLQGVEDLTLVLNFVLALMMVNKLLLLLMLADDEVTVDGNHPLAGLDLSFEVDILEVREATEEELEHGHIHGEGESCGHDHG